VVLTTNLGESLSGSLVLGDSDDVESDGLGERSALTDGDDVADLDSERRRAVGGEVLVSLLVSGVLGDVVLFEQGKVLRRERGGKEGKRNGR
jgi:hypothetical protein